jgi:hypothetical protein
MSKRIPCSLSTTQNPNVARTFFREAFRALFHFQEQPVLDYSFFEGHAAAYAGPPEHAGGATQRSQAAAMRTEPN